MYEGTNMKRLIAVLALLLGGLTTEMAAPVQCLLISNTQSNRFRRSEDDAE
jgi:hypothetical protein